MEAVFDLIKSQIPNIAVAVARQLATKLLKTGGITPKEAAAIAILDALEAFVNA